MATLIWIEATHWHLCSPLVYIYLHMLLASACCCSTHPLYSIDVTPGFWVMSIRYLLTESKAWGKMQSQLIRQGNYLCPSQGPITSKLLLLLLKSIDPKWVVVPTPPQKCKSIHSLSLLCLSHSTWSSRLALHCTVLGQERRRRHDRQLKVRGINELLIAFRCKGWRGLFLGTYRTHVLTCVAMTSFCDRPTFWPRAWEEGKGKWVSSDTAKNLIGYGSCSLPYSGLTPICVCVCVESERRRENWQDKMLALQCRKRPIESWSWVLHHQLTLASHLGLGLVCQIIDHVSDRSKGNEDDDEEERKRERESRWQAIVRPVCLDLPLEPKAVGGPRKCHQRPRHHLASSIFIY